MNINRYSEYPHGLTPESRLNRMPRSGRSMTLGISMLALLLTMVVSYPASVFAIDIKKEKLANGLTIIYVEKHGLPIVMATLLIKVSPLQEDPAKAGTAYLTSKMLAEGTAKRKSADISSQIDYIGASLDTAVNNDFTTVSLSVLKKDVETGFDLFSDIVIHPSFHVEELARRKTMLSGALKQKQQDPSYIAGRRFAKSIFGMFSYGRPVEGSIESVGRIMRDDTVRFYDNYYRPGNSTLVLVGDLSRDEVLKLANRYFGSWKDMSLTKAIKPEQALPKLERHTEIIDMDVSQANIVIGHRGISRGNPDYYAVQVMNYILGGGGFASRLMKVIRDEMGLTYSINSSFAPNLYPGAFEIDVQTKNESAGRVIEETMKQLRKMRAEGITDEELRDARDYLIGSFPRRLETSRKIADFLTSVQFYNLGDDYIDNFGKYIASVTKEDVLRVARKYLNDEDLLIIVVGNKKKLKL